MIVCAMMGSGVSAAYAKPKIYVTWEVSGSAGSPGGVTYTPVIVGVGDDGSSTFPQRFPNQGRKGSGGKMHESETGKVKSPDGKTACTIPPIEAHPPKGEKLWKMWVDPKLSDANKTAVRNAIDNLNRKLVSSGSSFRVVQIGTMEMAKSFVVSESRTFPISHPSAIGQTTKSIDRAGTIQTSLIVLSNRPLPAAVVAASAEHELGHSLGLGDVNSMDSDYPSRMDAVTTDRPPPMDGCMAAAIAFITK